MLNRIVKELHAQITALRDERDVLLEEQKIWRTFTTPSEQKFAHLSAQNLHLWNRLVKTERALQEIQTDCGRVCRNFELCTHAACRSSYTAWTIADKYFNPDKYKAPVEKPNPEAISPAQERDMADYGPELGGEA